MLRAVRTTSDTPVTLNSTDTLYIAHRGSGSIYPEETMVAYRNTFADGERWLEADVRTLSDGTLVMMHDATVDAVTTSTGNVSSFNATTWAALAIDANTWQGSNYGNALPAGVFQTFIDAFNGKAVLAVEDKDGVSMDAILLALKNSGVRRDQALVQSDSLTEVAKVVRSGYGALYLAAPTDDPATITAAGVEWIGLSDTASDSQILGFVGAGLNVLMYTVNRHYRRDQLLALGVRGLVSDDPTYLASRSALYTTDQFGRQTWLPGMKANSSDAGTFLANRGSFTANDYWGYSMSTADYRSCLMGHLCPVANPSNFTLDFKVTFDSANAGDTTRSASVFIGESDRPYDDTTGNTNSGYNLLMRKNGTVQIYRKASGQAASSLGSQTGTTIADAAEVAYRVTVTSAAIRLARLNGDGSENYGITVTNSDTRGAYLHFGRAGLACKFRSVSVV